MRMIQLEFVACLIRKNSVFLAFATCMLMAALPACKNEIDHDLIVSRANVKIEKGKEVEINYSDKGVVRIRAIAPSATRFNTEKPNLEFTDGIKILFFNQAHEVES